MTIGPAMNPHPGRASFVSTNTPGAPGPPLSRTATR